MKDLLLLIIGLFCGAIISDYWSQRVAAFIRLLYFIIFQNDWKIFFKEFQSLYKKHLIIRQAFSLGINPELLACALVLCYGSFNGIFLCDEIPSKEKQAQANGIAFIGVKNEPSFIYVFDVLYRLQLINISTSFTWGGRLYYRRSDVDYHKLYHLIFLFKNE